MSFIGYCHVNMRVISATCNVIFRSFYHRVFCPCTDDTESRKENELPESVFTPHSVDSVRLTNFLQQAGQVLVNFRYFNTKLINTH